MKKLISALTVKQAHKDGLSEIQAPAASTIITPEALTVAKELHIPFVSAGVNEKEVAKSGKVTVDESLVRTVVERVIEQLPPEKRQINVIRDVVSDVLMQYRG